MACGPCDSSRLGSLRIDGELRSFGTSEPPFGSVCRQSGGPRSTRQPGKSTGDRCPLRALGLFASVANAQDCSNAVRPPPPRACARAQLRWKAASPRLCPQNIVHDSSDSVNVADLLGLLAAYGRSGCAPCTCGGAVRARGPAPSLDCLSRWACCCTAQLPHPNPRAAPQDLDPHPERSDGGLPRAVSTATTTATGVEAPAPTPRTERRSGGRSTWARPTPSRT